MSQKQIHGISLAEIQANRVPLSSINECLPLLIPFKKCLRQESIYNQMVNGACEDEKRTYFDCQTPLYLRQSGIVTAVMRKNDPAKFQKQKVSPFLSNIYPSGLITE